MSSRISGMPDAEVFANDAPKTAIIFAWLNSTSRQRQKYVDLWTIRGYNVIAVSVRLPWTAQIEAQVSLTTLLSAAHGATLYAFQHRNLQKLLTFISFILVLQP
jgi:hypothetical protein